MYVCVYIYIYLGFDIHIYIYVCMYVLIFIFWFALYPTHLQRRKFPTEKMFWTFNAFDSACCTSKEFWNPIPSRPSNQFLQPLFFDQRFPHTLVLQSLVIQSHVLKLLQATDEDWKKTLPNTDGDFGSWQTVWISKTTAYIVLLPQWSSHWFHSRTAAQIHPWLQCGSSKTCSPGLRRNMLQGLLNCPKPYTML